MATPNITPNTDPTEDCELCFTLFNTHVQKEHLMIEAKQIVKFWEERYWYSIQIGLPFVTINQQLQHFRESTLTLEQTKINYSLACDDYVTHLLTHYPLSP